MFALAISLILAVVAACFLLVIVFWALMDISVERHVANDRVEHLEAECDALQTELNAALGRLSRKRKPSIELAS